MKADRPCISGTRSRNFGRYTARMSEPSLRTLKLASRALARGAALLFFFLLVSGTTRAQSWSWTYELIDLPAKFPSLAVDSNSNLHITYADSNAALKYGFRPAGSAKWFFMVIDKQLGAFTTTLTLDSNNNPHVCYTPGVIKYAHFDGKQWRITQIAKDSGEIGYTCSIAIAKDGTPHLTWYQLSGPTPNYLHMRYAVLKDSSWLVRTLDFDNETGKWNSMVLDAHSNPLISYSAWYNGELRLAHWNGKQWEFNTADSRARSQGEFNIGEGNSLVLGPDGKPHLSFYSEKALKYAHLVGEAWKVETVDQFTWLGSWAHFRSSIALDKRGFPHICFEDAGVLKHAFWDGKQWHSQVLARSGLDSFRYSTMALDRDDTIYIAFRDPEDNTLKLATGRSTSEQQNAVKKDAAPATP
jgi:hypothetical protein